jgi:glycosyltransferase involved in cell wall biosynthesis
LSFSLADVTLVPSEDTRLGLGGYKVRALRTVPLAVDTNFYRPGARSDGRPYVLTISHLTRENVERKLLLDVVRAAADAVTRVSDLHFVIVGGREDGGALVEEEIERLGLQDKVTLAGRVSVEEKRRLLRGASVYLQPTQYESFGVAIAEAMACGTPVVTSAVGAVSEVVGDTGILLAPDATAADLADAVIAQLNRETRDWEARERIIKRFSYEARKHAITQVLADFEPAPLR